MTDSRVELSLPVVGMTCASCHTQVDNALKVLPGVSDVAVDQAAHRVRLVYDPSQATVKEMVRAVEAIGYLVMNPELTLDIHGMTSGSCVDQVEQTLKALPGVEDVTVNLGSNTAHVRYVAGALSLAAMREAVRQAGCEAEEQRTIEQDERPRRSLFPWRLKRRRHQT